MNDEQRKAMWAKANQQQNKIIETHKDKFIVKDLTGKPYYGDKGVPWQDWTNYENRINNGKAHKMWDQLLDVERDLVLSKAISSSPDMIRFHHHRYWTEFSPKEQLALLRAMVGIPDKVHKSYIMEEGNREASHYGKNHEFAKRYYNRLN